LELLILRELRARFSEQFISAETTERGRRIEGEKMLLRLQRRNRARAAKRWVRGANFECVARSMKYGIILLL
jgi:hypothetical protein